MARILVSFPDSMRAHGTGTYSGFVFHGIARLLFVDPFRGVGGRLAVRIVFVLVLVFLVLYHPVHVLGRNRSIGSKGFVELVQGFAILLGTERSAFAAAPYLPERSRPVSNGQIAEGEDVGTVAVKQQEHVDGPRSQSLDGQQSGPDSLLLLMLLLLTVTVAIHQKVVRKVPVLKALGNGNDATALGFG